METAFFIEGGKFICAKKDFVKIEYYYQNVILSIAKNLHASTLCIQILHFAQNDTTKIKRMCITTHPP